MKRVLCLLCLATLPSGSALAAAPASKNAKVTLVYQHELPNCPGKSIKGVLVEYGPGGYSPGHTHPRSAFIYATVLEGAIHDRERVGLARLRPEVHGAEAEPADLEARAAEVRVVHGDGG